MPTHFHVLTLQKLRQAYSEIQTLLSELTASDISFPLEKLIEAPPDCDINQKKVYTRLQNCLRRPENRWKRMPGPCQIQSVHELLMWRKNELMEIQKFGPGQLLLLEQLLHKYGLEIGQFADFRPTQN
jgi:DNA-directed RNA polymerase alpha subunit